MSKVITCWIVTQLVAVCVCNAQNAAQILKSIPDEDTVVTLRPTGEVESTDLRETLNENLEHLARQTVARQEISDKLFAEFDGSVGAALKLNYVNLLLMRDAAEMHAAIAPVITELRWEIQAVRRDDQTKVDCLTNQVVSLQEDLNSLADKMVELENDKSISPAAKKRKSSFLNRRMEEVSSHIDGVEHSQLRVDERIKSYLMELNALDQLEYDLNEESELITLRVDRLCDAIEDGGDRLVADSLESKRAPLRKAWEYHSDVITDDSAAPVYASVADRMKKSMPIYSIQPVENSDPVADGKKSARVEAALEFARNRKK